MPHAASLLIPRLGRYGSTELLRHAIVLRSGQPGFQAHRCINTNLASRVAWFLAKDTLTIIDLFATRFGQRSTRLDKALSQTAEVSSKVTDQAPGHHATCDQAPGKTQACCNFGSDPCRLTMQQARRILGQRNWTTGDVVIVLHIRQAYCGQYPIKQVSRSRFATRGAREGGTRFFCFNPASFPHPVTSSEMKHRHIISASGNILVSSGNYMYDEHLADLAVT